MTRGIRAVSPAIDSVRQFRRLMQTALISGGIAGTVFFVYQQVLLAPIIAAAEAYEAHAGEVREDIDWHEHSEWKPAEGRQRISLTAASTILTGIGFGALLVSVAAIARYSLDIRKGLAWGFGGFVSFALAPALGLPPVPPGVPVADLQARQAWWVFTVATTAIALFLLFAKRQRWIGRAAGAILLFIPHVIGAPHATGPRIVPAQLVRSFALASIGGSAIFWIVLGAAAGLSGGTTDQQSVLQSTTPICERDRDEQGSG